MRSRPMTAIYNGFCFCMVLLAGVFRLVGKQARQFSYNSIIFVLFTAAITLWYSQVRRRLVQPEVRRNMAASALLMLFWMAVRTLKYDFFLAGQTLTRYAWYLYYVPMIYVPLLLFLSVLHIGLPAGQGISRRWVLLFIPATVILLAVLTNDLHQQAFYFLYGLEMWDEVNVIRGPVYYAAMGSSGVLLVAALGVVFARCAVPGRRRMIWAPLLTLVGTAVCVLTVILGRENMMTKLLTVPEIGCLVFAVFTESLIGAHLIPSNDNYGAFWNASNIGAGIMDEGGAIRYRSERSVPVSHAQVLGALEQETPLEGGSVSLKSHRVTGGYSYWTRDVSEINRLNRELEDLGDVLEQENTMLEAENRMRQERVRIEEQNRLYDDIARGVQAQLDRLDGILEQPPEDEAGFEAAMKFACVLNAYVKRRSNLLLFARQGGLVHSGELWRAVAESLEYVQLCGVHAQGFTGGEGLLGGEQALLAYDLFEAVLETALPGTRDLLVYQSVTGAQLILRVELSGTGAAFTGGDFVERLEAMQGGLEIEEDEGTQCVSLTLPAGGEGQ